jgi:hypothetical protein
MFYVTELPETFDQHSLRRDYEKLVETFEFHNAHQISVTSTTGNNDWDCCVGSSGNLEYPEESYTVINKYLSGSYTEKCIKMFPDYYRWRFLVLEPKSCYTIHRDYAHPIEEAKKGKINYRIHMPLITNAECYMCFYQDNFTGDGAQSVYYKHMEAGKCYDTCTSNQHTAINHHMWLPRVHLVGINNRFPDK